MNFKQWLLSEEIEPATKQWFQESTFLKTYVPAFASLSWDWEAMQRQKVVQPLFYYPKETYVKGQPERYEDYMFSLITLDNLKGISPDTLSVTNLHTGNKPDQALVLKKFKNTSIGKDADWYNDKIDQVYNSIKMIGKTPEDFGGREIKK